ncbi:hypothetical protein FGB62_178g017 [Gracilaria domingensis]|nr:hypothetical protein FGB62_178g017 [Gracilaria domingensis]
MRVLATPVPDCTRSLITARRSTLRANDETPSDDNTRRREHCTGMLLDAIGTAMELENAQPPRGLTICVAASAVILAHAQERLGGSSQVRECHGDGDGELARSNSCAWLAQLAFSRVRGASSKCATRTRVRIPAHCVPSSPQHS